jgi:hypothetical protein
VYGLRHLRPAYTWPAAGALETAKITAKDLGLISVRGLPYTRKDHKHFVIGHLVIHLRHELCSCSHTDCVSEVSRCCAISLPTFEPLRPSSYHASCFSRSMRCSAWSVCPQLSSSPSGFVIRMFVAPFLPAEMTSAHHSKIAHGALPTNYRFRCRWRTGSRLSEYSLVRKFEGGAETAYGGADVFTRGS